MVTWREFENDAADLAKDVRRVFEAATSHVLATLRKDGSPRVSGIEVAFAGDELTFGSMLNAVKAKDLLRDGRFALHSTPAEGGDAKISGLAVEVEGDAEAEPSSHTFRLDIRQVVFTNLGDDQKHLLIRTWKPGRGIESVKRY
jgi:hypothetical protein